MHIINYNDYFNLIRAKEILTNHDKSFKFETIELKKALDEITSGVDNIKYLLIINQYIEAYRIFSSDDNSIIYYKIKNKINHEIKNIIMFHKTYKIVDYKKIEIIVKEKNNYNYNSDDNMDDDLDDNSDDNMDDDLDDDFEDDCIDMDQWSYFIVDENNKICGFLKNDDYSIKDVLLSENIDWIIALNTIILFGQKQTTQINQNLLEIESKYMYHHDILKKIFIEIFDGTFYKSKYYFFCKKNYHKKFDGNLKIKINGYNNERNDINKIFSHNTNCILTKIPNKDDCGCKYERYYLIFENPLIHAKKGDIVINLSIMINDKIYVFDDNSLLDNFYGLRLNKIWWKYNMDIDGDTWINFIHALELPCNVMGEKNNIYEKKTKKCLICRDQSFSSDANELRKFLIDTVKIIPLKYNNFQTENKIFKIDKKFIPNNLLLDKTKTQICLNNSILLVSETEGYVYLLQIYDLIKNCNIYKIGKTGRTPYDRMKEYTQGMKILVIENVDNYNVMENNILSEFNKNSKIIKCDKGNEYFLCDDTKYIKTKFKECLY
jgi:hypothetical protein